MGDLGSGEVEQLDKNMWAPDENEDKQKASFLLSFVIELSTDWRGFFILTLLIRSFKMDKISCFGSICEVPHNDPYVNLPPSLYLNVNYLHTQVETVSFLSLSTSTYISTKKLSSFFVWSHFWISHQSACLDWCQCFNTDSAVGWAWKTWIWRWNGRWRRDKDSCKRWYICSIDKLKWRMNICILHQPLCLVSWLDFLYWLHSPDNQESPEFQSRKSLHAQPEDMESDEGEGLSPNAEFHEFPQLNEEVCPRAIE